MQVMRRKVKVRAELAEVDQRDELWGRLTVILADVQGFTYEEIAQATGVEMGTVKSRLCDSLLMAPRRACAAGGALRRKGRLCVGSV